MIERRFLLALLCVVFLLARNTFSKVVSSEEDKDVTREKKLLVRKASVGDDKKTVVTKEGDTIKLECAFPAQPWSYVQWVKLYYSDGFRHSVIPTNETYTNDSAEISSVVVEDISKDDAGNYSCISTATSGATAFEFHVIVKEALFCDEDFCSPNGDCSELPNGYLCNCHEGYVGKHCEIQDPCRRNPCLNNGSCLTMAGSFNCSCQEGFVGDKCEREICTSESCNGGGSCSESIEGNIRCNCRYDRAGERCQHRCTFSNSRSRYCRYKTCVISNNGRERCECQNTYSNHCIMESDVRNECLDPDICNRRGTCRDYTYKYKCECHSYSSGKDCEYYNECSSGNNVCRQNGGICVDLPVGYKCTNCPAGQHGDKCQYKPNPCKVTCLQTAMEIKCDMRFLNEKLSSVPLYLNSKSCELGRNRRYGYSSRYVEATRTVDYGSCDTDLQYEKGFAVYRNSVRSGSQSTTDAASDIITRIQGYFRFDVECRIPLFWNSSSNLLEDMSLRANETVYLEEKGDIDIDRTSIEFYNEKWQRVTKYVIGDRLYVKMYASSISNRLLQRYGILNPVTCFATADQQGSGPRYILLEKGCIRDETFRFETQTRNRGNNRLESYFSFDSFSFKNRPGKLYVHCKGSICLNNSALRNETELTSCKIACDENKDAGQNTTTTPELLTSTSREEIGEPLRKKRSIGFFPHLRSTFEIQDDSKLINRLPGPDLVLEQGLASL